MARPTLIQLRTLLPPAAPVVVETPLSVADLAGRVVEVTGQGASACTSWLAGLVAQAQAAGETAAWVQLTEGALYPPDLQAVGIDTAALAVARLPDVPAMLRAADVLLRSGGFGLVVIDLDGAALRPNDSQLGRLLGLCQKHGAALVFRTRPNGDAAEPPSMGSLVSLRLRLRRERRGPSRYAAVAETIKDKRRGPGRRLETEWLAPDGVV